MNYEYYGGVERFPNTWNPEQYREQAIKIMPDKFMTKGAEGTVNIWHKVKNEKRFMLFENNSGVKKCLGYFEAYKLGMELQSKKIITI